MARACVARVSVVVMLLLGGSSLPAAADSAPALQSSIPRFSQVGERLYRGGQPREQDFAYLRSLGIRTIISLREDDRERALVESLGMKFVHIPVTFIAFAPTTRVPQAAVEKFFEVIDDPASGPVFVHCRRGADRTGAFVGLYRMVRENWSAQRAYDEARRIGMRWWYFGVKDQLDEIATLLAHTAAAKKTLAENEPPTLPAR